MTKKENSTFVTTEYPLRKKISLTIDIKVLKATLSSWF